MNNYLKKRLNLTIWLERRSNMPVWQTIFAKNRPKDNFKKLKQHP